VCQRDACAVANRGDGRRHATVVGVGSLHPVGFKGEICSLIFLPSYCQKKPRGGASYGYGSKNGHVRSCAMWFGIGLFFGAKMSAGIFSSGWMPYFDFFVFVSNPSRSGLGKNLVQICFFQFVVP
jgi:hypothetical protein